MKKRSVYGILLIFMSLLMVAMGCRTQKMQTKYGVRVSKYNSVEKSEVAVNAEKR